MTPTWCKSCLCNPQSCPDKTPAGPKCTIGLPYHPPDLTLSPVSESTLSLSPAPHSDISTILALLTQQKADINSQMRELQQQVSSYLGAQTSAKTSQKPLPESINAYPSSQVLNLTPDPAPIFTAPGLTAAMQAGLGMQHSSLTKEYLRNNTAITSKAWDTQGMS